MRLRRLALAALATVSLAGLGACGQGEDEIGDRVDNPGPDQVVPRDDDGSGTRDGDAGDPSSGDGGSGSSIPGGNTSGGGGSEGGDPGMGP